MTTIPLITSIAGGLKSADERTTEALASRGIMLIAPVRTARIVGGRSLTTIIGISTIVGDSPIDASAAFLSAMADVVEADKLIGRFVYQKLIVLPVPAAKFTKLAEAVGAMTGTGIVKTLPTLVENYLDAAEYKALLDAVANLVKEAASGNGINFEDLAGDNLLAKATDDVQVAFVTNLIMKRIFSDASTFKTADLASNIQYFAGAAISREYITADTLVGSEPNGLSELDLSAKLVTHVTYLRLETEAVFSTLLSTSELMAASQNGTINPSILQSIDTTLSQQIPDDRKTMLPGVEAVVHLATGPNDGGLSSVAMYAALGIPDAVKKVAEAPVVTTDAPAVAPAVVDAAAPEQTDKDAAARALTDALEAD